jgi:hypothetical protein
MNSSFLDSSAAKRLFQRAGLMYEFHMPEKEAKLLLIDDLLPTDYD